MKTWTVDRHSDFYPSGLYGLSSPPPHLHGLGKPALLALPAVACIGSRQSPPEALAWARTVGQFAARAGLVLVSGLARGADRAAHFGALDFGDTIAYLGGGVAADTWPAADRIRRHGALVCEVDPGARVTVGQLMARNRLIAAHSRAVFVAAFGESSGTWNGTEAALRLGRAVFLSPQAAAHPDGQRAIAMGAAPADRAPCLPALMRAIAADPALAAPPRLPL